MLGGGTFATQNKILPGAYINFVSLKTASATLSDRGVATMALELDWGVENEIFEVSASDFAKESLKIFGYSQDHEKLKGLRDLFKNITTLYAYRINGNGVKATNNGITAKYSGTRGNSLTVTLESTLEGLVDVKTTFDGVVVDRQTISKGETPLSNDYVDFGTFKAEIAEGESAQSIALVGGANGSVNGETHQTYLDKVESYSFNTMGVITTEDSIKTLYVNFCKRMRDEVGMKFQVVIYNKSADFEGVINVKNKVTDSGWSESALVYWVTGIEAGCAINKSTLNSKYDGEFTVDVNYTQNQLENAIKSGEFAFHKVGSDIRILEDINSLVTVTEQKGDIFKDNQTIRVVDQVANDIAVLFNTKYLGAIPNDASGRISFWSDVVKHHEEMQRLRAIENFNDADVTVEAGSDRKSIVVNDAITPIGTMSKLYMTTVVR